MIRAGLEPGSSGSQGKCPNHCSILPPYIKTRRSVSVKWIASGTCYTKTEGTELGGIEGAENWIFLGVMPKIKNRKKEKKPRNPISSPGNSYNGRSMLEDRARMRHISHHPKSSSVRKRNTTSFLFPFYFRVNYFHNEVEWPIKTGFVIKILNIYEMQKQSCEHVKLHNRKS